MDKDFLDSYEAIVVLSVGAFLAYLFLVWLF